MQGYGMTRTQILGDTMQHNGPLDGPEWARRLTRERGSLQRTTSRLALLAWKEAPVPLDRGHLHELLSPQLIGALADSTESLQSVVKSLSSITMYKHAHQAHTEPLAHAAALLAEASNKLDDIRTDREAELRAAGVPCPPAPATAPTEPDA